MKLARLLFLLCLLLVLCTSGRAQCPVGNVFITSDAEAMAYEVNFGSCTDLPGDLGLDGPITYTKAFQNIQKINGTLSFVSTAFDFMDDFSGLKSVGGRVTIKGTALKGELATVSLELATVGGPFELDNNNQLEGTAALDNLTSIGQLTVTSNPNLSNINGLGDATISGKVTIQDNASLSNCAVDGVCAAVTANVQNNTTILISNNTGNCASKYHVEAQCLGFPACPPDAFLFDNQGVSDFDDAFPLCENLSGTLSLVSPITNAFPLGNLETVGGDVVINGLPDLDFMALTAIGGDLNVQNIPNGPELTSGPLPLQTVGGRMEIAFCSQITDLASFGNLTSVNELGLFTLLQLNSLSGLQNLELDNGLFLFNLDQLTSLASMSGINISGKTFERLLIEGNFRLENINYLDNLAHISDDLRINNNTNLSECSVTPICSTIGEGTALIQVTNNSEDCNSIAEVKNICFPDLVHLLAVYNAAGGPNWSDKAGWQTAAALGQNCDPCNGWYGVNCENGRVVFLDLQSNNLEGPIDPAIYRLSRLRDLRLNSNQLSGSFSGDVGLLTELESLNLFANELSGGIPGGLGLCTNLTSLGLGRNNFNGTFPVSFRDLTNLRILRAQDCNLSGPLPTFLEDLPLQFLVISNNDFSGPLPELDMTIVRQFILSNNDFSGCYPATYTEICDNNFGFTGNPGLPDGGSTDFFENQFCLNNNVCGSLPVSWQSFIATPEGKTVVLQWATSAEENNAGFTVERSANGNTWTGISALLPSQATGVYHFVDDEPLTGTSFYRIRQTDYDGVFDFSAVAQVNLGVTSEAAFPNPFQGAITVYASTPEVIQVVDQAGRLVQTFQHAGAGAQVQRLALASGVYTLRYRSSGRVERIVAR